MSTVLVLQFIPAQNSLLFSSDGISGCRFPLNLAPNLARTNYKCAMKINNLIKLNCLVL